MLEKARERHASLWEDWCEDLGAAGTVLAAMCCLGIPSVLSLVSALGLGFLANGPFRAGLLVLFIFLTLAGLLLGLLHHGKPWPLLLGLCCAVAVYYSSV